MLRFTAKAMVFSFWFGAAAIPLCLNVFEVGLTFVVPVGIFFLVMFVISPFYALAQVVFGLALLSRKHSDIIGWSSVFTGTLTLASMVAVYFA